MKKTYALAVLFFASLAILWWLDYARVPRPEEQRARMNRVLRNLFDVRVREIRRIEIQRGEQLTSFERLDANRWQMVKPYEAAADPAIVNNLIQNLIDLSRSPDVGTIAESGQSYGLEPPSSVIRVYGTRSAQSAQGTEIEATLEIGKGQKDVRFVRPLGEAGIEAVDAKLLSALDLSLADWREKSLLPVPTFQVAGLSVQAGNSSYEATRNRAGQWTLRKPVVVPANGLKIDSLLTGLSAARVADGAEGFVANDVKDLSKFGLAPAEVTVTLKMNGSTDQSLVLQLGKAVPDKSDRVYAKRGDQDDVVLVDAKILADIPRNPKDLRVSKVTDLEPARIVKIGIDAPSRGTKFELNRNSKGWEQLEPNTDRVDPSSIQSLIGALNDLQTSELFDPVGPDDPRMTPVAMTVKLWQQGRTAPGSKESSIESQPSLSLQIGRHDPLRKTVYGRLEGDSFVLALPDTIVKVLPKNAYAFRDRTVLALNPGLIKSLSIKQNGQTREVAPATGPGSANQWKLVAPVEGKADMPTLSKIFASLGQLRVEDFITDAKDAEQDRQFGLDHPSMEVVWETEAKGNPSSTAKALVSGRLKVGSRVGRTSAFYAKLDRFPIIFTLDVATLSGFENELRDHNIFAFPTERARKVLLRWPNRAVSFVRKAGPSPAVSPWTADPSTDATGVDAARIDPLVSQLSRLETIRFLQYDGLLPVMTGLVPPRLSIEIQVEGESQPRVLRIGRTRDEGLVYAAEGTGGSGPVFFLPAAAWNSMVESGQQMVPFPDDVFAPVSPP